MQHTNIITAPVGKHTQHTAKCVQNMEAKEAIKKKYCGAIRGNKSEWLNMAPRTKLQTTIKCCVAWEIATLHNVQNAHNDLLNNNLKLSHFHCKVYKTMKNNAKRIDINEVVNMNGKEKKFSFRAAKLHFSSGLYNHIMKIEGNKLQREGKTFGTAQARHYSLTREELQNKAFLTCRTALQKGKLPKGVKEKDVKAVCFDASFIVTLEKCQIATGFNSDKLLRAIDKELKTSAKKNSKKSKK